MFNKSNKAVYIAKPVLPYKKDSLILTSSMPPSISILFKKFSVNILPVLHPRLSD